jgi:hypothetical protein
MGRFAMNSSSTSGVGGRILERAEEAGLRRRSAASQKMQNKQQQAHHQR